MTIEGLSYVSETPFIIIDLFNLRSIDVDIENESSWVESGATIGEFYYAIAQRSKVCGFPGGICHTIGVGDILAEVDLVRCSGSMVWQLTMSLMLRLLTLMESS
ncbi:hypothetical protein Prudu_011404 [Prunus dulcis]|uniref:Uncharacterized protein n=1 Tax=Prunus dulcis TaxID=3755 RepID=A0A4Y1RAI1_PRUDU|nr:hypothetical protein Prudu_011404 [Prunus dulcis]